MRRNGLTLQRTNVTFTQANRPFAVTTPLGKDILLLAGFSGQEQMSKLYHFQLDLVAEHHIEIPFDRILGQPVTVEIALEEGKKRYFHGIVNRFCEGKRDDWFQHYRAEVVPQLWLQSRRLQSRIFQHQSVPDILKQVLQGQNVAFEIQGTFHPRDYCVQYQESDFAFASRLMEDEGIYYFFKHKADQHVMVVANTPLSHPNLPEQSTLLFEEDSGGNRPEFRITGWEKQQELRPGKVTLWDHTFELPHKHLEAQKRIVDSVAVGQVTHKLRLNNSDQLEIYEYPGGYAQRFDGVDRSGCEKPENLEKIFEDNARTAAIRMQQETVPGLSIHGTSNCRQLVAGHRFTLSRHANADGDYIVTGVEHTAHLGDNFHSGNGGTFEYENRFTCIPAALAFRPPRETPKPRIQGTQTATVVGPPGPEEIYTDKFGRVKVKFHWDRQATDPADSSCWIRVSTLWAGKQWGMIHIPRRDQEVIVDFIEGDPDRPIIIGSVYNAEMMPPLALPANRKISGCVSRSNQSSTGGYNRITYNDASNQEEMLVHAQRDLKTTIENDEDWFVGNDRDMHVVNNDKEKVGQVQSIEVGNDRTVKVGGSNSMEVECLSSVDAKFILLKASESITLVCGGSRIIIQDSGIWITSDGSININGKPVNLNC